MEERVQEPLMHFGTCDDRKDQSEFIEGVENLFRRVRAEFKRITFVFFEVLPQQESFIDPYNKKGEACDFNLLHMELVDQTEKIPRCSLVNSFATTLWRNLLFPNTVNNYVSPIKSTIKFI